MGQLHRLAKLTSLQKIQKNLDLVLFFFLTVEYISNGHSRSARSVDLFATPPICYDLSICSLGPTDRRPCYERLPGDTDRHAVVLTDTVKDCEEDDAPAQTVVNYSMSFQQFINLNALIKLLQSHTVLDLIEFSAGH